MVFSKDRDAFSDEVIIDSKLEFDEISSARSLPMR